MGFFYIRHRGWFFWVRVPRCRGGGLLVLVLGDWPSARVARCRSDVGFFYIRHRGWFFWVRVPRCRGGGLLVLVVLGLGVTL